MGGLVDEASLADRGLGRLLPCRGLLYFLARPVAATKLGIRPAARFQPSAFQRSAFGNLFSETSSQNAKKSRRKS